MKLLIPPAKKLFKSVKTPKEPSVEEKVMNWLNTDVYEELMSAEPSLSPNLPVKVTGSVYVDTPYDYFKIKNDFVRITKAKLVPIGYKVEFTWKGDSSGDMCIIKWEA